jgi:hypothetical protein
MKLVLRSAVMLLIASACARYLTRLEPQGDTFVLVGDVRRMIAAFRGGAGTGFSGQFALLQQIPATALELAGMSDTATVRMLALVNLLAFVGLLARAWLAANKTSRAMAVVLVLVLIASPLLWYARTSFGEMLAAYFTLAFAVRSSKARPGAGVYVAGFLAGISKETAFLFLPILGVAAAASNPAFRQERSARNAFVRSLIAIALLSFVTNGAFNYLRFGTLTNRFYSNPAFTVSLRDQASFFAGLWFSPNGGVLVFWPAFFALLVASVFAARRSWRFAQDEASRIAAVVPVAGISIAMLGLTVGLSRWAFPMGWICWGSRFLVPWLPAFAYVLMDAYSPDLVDMLRRATASPWTSWALAIVLTAIAVPQFAVLFKPSMISNFFAPDAAFPAVAIIHQDRDYYLHFINYLLWRKLSPWCDAYRLTPVNAALFTFASSIGLLWLWSWCASRVRTG